MFACRTYYALKNLSIIKNTFDKLKIMQISFGKNFEKIICQRWTTGKKGNLQQTKSLQKAISFG